MRSRFRFAIIRRSTTDVGADLGTPVAEAYAVSFRFTGKTIELKEDKRTDLEDTERARRAAALKKALEPNDSNRSIPGRVRDHPCGSVRRNAPALGAAWSPSRRRCKGHHPTGRRPDR